MLRCDRHLVVVIDGEARQRAGGVRLLIVGSISGQRHLDGHRQWNRRPW